MKEILSTITSKGQVTIPKEVRQQLGLSTNDRIAFVIEDDGSVRLSVPQFPTIASLAGIAGSLKQPLTYEEMRPIAREDYLTGEYPGEHPVRREGKSEVAPDASGSDATAEASRT